MNEIIDYIIEFLIRDKNLASLIGYCSDESKWDKYKIIIVPSNFFNDNIYGTKESMPSFPLKEIEGIPFLYGDSKIEERNGKIICYADLIASTYFLISRYQEFIFPNKYRDEHGRFIGKESIPYKGGFINKPIVEEYGFLIGKLLNKVGINAVNIPNKFNKIYLTHDVDILTSYRKIRSCIGGIYRSFFLGKDNIKDIWNSTLNIHNDISYTFPFIYRLDNSVKEAIPIYFIKAAKKANGFDYPGYNLRGKDFNLFLAETKEANPNTIFGLHASYASGSDPSIIEQEKKKLQKNIGQEIIKFNRHHYLRALQPKDMEYLIKANFTDDFTMGYADIAGFRLGTCRSVKYINPETRKLTSLNLHPLTIMDCSLSESKYMNLNYGDAFKYATNLINETKKYNGDITLLWHNSTFPHKNYHKDIYKQLIQSLCR